MGVRRGRSHEVGRLHFEIAPLIEKRPSRSEKFVTNPENLSVPALFGLVDWAGHPTSYTIGRRLSPFEAKQEALFIDFSAPTKYTFCHGEVTERPKVLAC